MTRLHVLALVAATLILVITVVPRAILQPAHAQSAATITPVADAYVLSTAGRARNFGQEPELVASQAPEMMSYLRFDVPNVNGEIQRVFLRTYALENHRDGFEVHPVSTNDWQETKILASNAPRIETAVIANSGTLRKGEWNVVDVTSFVTGPGSYSMALTTTSTNQARVASRESGKNAPQLIVMTTAPREPAVLTPTPSPTPLPSPTSPSTSTPQPSPSPTPVPSATPPSGAPPAASSVLINAGGTPYKDGNGQYWAADTNYRGGLTTTFMQDVFGTSDDALYQSQHHGFYFTYRFDLPPGQYDVSLLFAEGYWPKPGHRLFNVVMENRLVLTNFDILSEVPRNTALTKTFTVAVSDGALDLMFLRVKDNATVSAIAITPAGSTAPNPDPEPSPSASPEPSPSASPEASPEPSPSASPEPDPGPEPFPGSGPNAVAPGSMNLTSTFNSVGIELFFTGDDNQNAVANLEFKRSGESTWREGLPLWGTYGSPRAFYGSALLLDAGATYDIRISFTDPDGINGNFTVTGSIATRADNIQSASSLTPTHYVSTTGKDSNSGTSLNSAWRTIEKAFQSAPPGAVVKVESGSYAPPLSSRTSPITLVGNNTIIEPQTTVGPNAGAWQQVTLTGPATRGNYKVWKWTAPLADANLLTLESTGTTPETVASWKRPNKDSNGYTMQTPAGWAEVLYRNDLYNFGFTSFGNDIYLRLPDDRNPNNYRVRVHYTNGYDNGRVTLDAPNSRITGITFNMVGILIREHGDNATLDHNRFVNADLFFLANQNVTPNKYPKNPIVEYNTFTHTGLYDPALEQDAIAWKFIKGPMYISGVKTSWSRIGDKHEVTAVSGRGGARGLIMRYNVVEGYFNGVGAYMQGFDRYGKGEYDVYDNTFRYIADDVFEPDQGSINWRVWNNRVEMSSVAVSLGPAHYGPFYLFRNTFYQMTNDGVGPDNSGDTTVSVLMFKYSASSNPPLLAYVISNTFHSDDPDAMGGYKAAGGSGSPEWFYLRNNVFVMHRYVFSARANSTGTSVWDEDYNAWYTTDPSRGIEYGGRNWKTIDAYREASGQGAHSNPHGDFHDLIILQNPSGGNLGLSASSPLIDAGVVVPNITETYRGDAPDIGAVEH